MARGRPMKNADNKGNGNGANLGFEAKLWATADKLRGNMEPSDYKHVALGLIFLKYISDAFEAKRAALLEEELADPEDPEEYLAENVFWVPKEARWSHLQANAKQTTIGKLIDDAMLAIEAKNANPGVLALRGKVRNWARLRAAISCSRFLLLSSSRPYVRPTVLSSSGRSR